MFGDVIDLCVTQDDLRLGARGALWDWTSGQCVETISASIAEEAGYNIPNLFEAAKLIGFRDARSMQILTARRDFRWIAMQPEITKVRQQDHMK